MVHAKNIKHIPLVAVRKSGRRPTRSTRKAQPTLTIKLRSVWPPLSCDICLVKETKGRPGMAYRDFLALLCNAHAVVDQVDIVAEKSVPRVLRNYTKRNKDSQSVAVALSPHEVKIAARLFVFKFESESLLNFTELEGDCCVLPVTIGVVMGQDGFGLFVTLLRDEPTWGFWDPVDKCELNQCRHTLKKSESSPRPTIWDG
jgi:hypothetical protein